MELTNAGKQSCIVIKGYAEGLRFYIDRKASMERIIEDLTKLLKDNESFFEGSSPKLHIVSREFNFMEQHSIASVIDKVVKYRDLSFEDSDEGDLVPMDTLFEENESSDWGYFDGLKEGPTKFVTGLIRSGQRIFFNGNLVIIGDVNPGAELVASGNIIVLGSLLGLAHAGVTGNYDAFIIALRLFPSQIRIADRLTRLDRIHSDDIYPEKVFISEDKINIVPLIQRELSPKTRSWFGSRSASSDSIEE